jgi:hypothetical protein
LNIENGGKRRTWVQKRNKGRKREKIRKERTTHETDVHLQYGCVTLIRASERKRHLSLAKASQHK